MKTINLTKNAVAIVDDDDYEKIKKYKWSLFKNKNFGFYAVNVKKINGHNHTTHMHRFILNPPDGVIIDHINRNGLDNRKCNLRFATTQTNAFNREKPRVICTSKYKGVLRRHGKGAWLARIKYNDRHVELGQYDCEEKAASVYNFASRIFFGEYRRENKGVDELTNKEKEKIFNKCNRYIKKYGWYVDTEVYHSFFMENKTL